MAHGYGDIDGGGGAHAHRITNDVIEPGFPSVNTGTLSLE